jgi:hypothetical protein
METDCYYSLNICSAVKRLGDLIGKRTQALSWVHPEPESVVRLKLSNREICFLKRWNFRWRSYRTPEVMDTMVFQLTYGAADS